MAPGGLRSFVAEYTDEVWNRGKVGAMDLYYTRITSTMTFQGPMSCR